jgi:DeoR/GlpR family transcriptional regulator of sugar metabolism
MIEQAKGMVAVADASKISHVAHARLCALAQVGELIIKRGADPSRRAQTDRRRPPGNPLTCLSLLLEVAR